ncbi:hypothetical protein BGW37DRAFT_523110 [Umbelopsis sp. PMI_123]|nr:hypothetical protein BGW37DRAFT_523110 [Umbelopsis sp. PMI_123]
MFSQNDERTVGSFSVYKDPIGSEADVHISTPTNINCDAAPLADASNIVKPSRQVDHKMDPYKKQTLHEEKRDEVTKRTTVEPSTPPSEDDISNSPAPTTSLSEKPHDKDTPQIPHNDIIKEDLIDRKESSEATVVDRLTEISSDSFPPDANKSPHIHDQSDTSEQLSIHSVEKNNVTQAPPLSVSQDSQDFGDDLEFDSQMLEKLQEIETKVFTKTTSTIITHLKAAPMEDHEETEEDFGPEIDAEVLASIENKTTDGDKNSKLVSSNAPVESYEEITSWLEEFDDMDDMFNVDLDSQFFDTSTMNKPRPHSPAESSLESLLQSSELDTQKIMSEVNSITSKYGGFSTGSKKPLTTALSMEAVTNLFEKKTSSKRSVVNKNRPVRSFNRSTTPKPRPQFGGFVNARTNAALRASESAKRKAAKAFGEDGELLYQINDMDAPVSIEDSIPQNGKSQKVSDAFN